MTTDETKLKPLPKRKPTTAPAKPGPTLTFSDGLNFGCGFWVAGFLFLVIGLPTIAFILAIFGLNL